MYTLRRPRSTKSPKNLRWLGFGSRSAAEPGHFSILLVSRRCHFATGRENDWLGQTFAFLKKFQVKRSDKWQLGTSSGRKGI